MEVEEGYIHTTSIYPNPTDGVINIISQGEQCVTIYNMTGQSIFESQCSGELQIDMKRFGAGIYAVKVGNESTRIVVK